MYEKVANYPHFIELEHEVLTFWAEADIFAKLRAQISGKEPWSFLDGPITANNPMGVHHAWGRTLKDIYQRFQAMRGRDLRFQNGFDCQGLWVEVEVEKALGFSSKKDIAEYGIAAFVRECKQRVLTYAAKQTEQSIRLGYWMDWDDPQELLDLRDALMADASSVTYKGASRQVKVDTPEAVIGALGSPDLGGSYFTFSDQNNYAIWRFLKTCHNAGDVARTTDVMPWCPRCGTGLSQMEVAEGRQIVSHEAVYVRFPVRGRLNEALVAWTTTPWTLPANVALAVNPKAVYLRVLHNGWTYFIGKDNFDAPRKTTLEAEGKRVLRNLPSIRQLLKAAGEEPVVIAEVPGAELVGLAYDGPFDDLDAQQVVRSTVAGRSTAALASHIVIPWAEVTSDEGTGVVHIAPGCGAEDYRLGLIHNLPVVAPLDPEGHFLLGFGRFSGESTARGTQLAVEHLGARGSLVAREAYIHVYPHCWRCKTELVFRLIDGWKIRMGWRQSIIDSVPTATWIPPEGEKRELDWLRNMGDWLISKNRYWGLALPIWQCTSPCCDWFDVLGSKKELQSRATAGWRSFEGHSPHRPFIDEVKIACARCGEEASRVPEVGNPWLDAGIVALSTLRFDAESAYWHKWFPADLVLESFPGQFRNWFYALLAMSVKETGIAPFRSLLGHASVHDERGEEMHKSKGNSVAFDEAAEAVGAEPMRFIFASQPTTSNLKFPDIRKTGGERTLFDELAVRRMMPLWNCYRFFMTYAEVEQWTPRATSHLVERSLLDRWILSRLRSLVDEANTHLTSYQVHRFIEQVDRFNDDLSNWYLRRSRSRFWTAGPDPSKAAAFSTLFEVIETELRLLAPILPFLTEEMYQKLVRVAQPEALESVHLLEYPEPNSSLRDDVLEKQMALVISVKNLGHSLRNQAKIRVRQPLRRILVRTSSPVAQATLADPVFRSMLEDELNVGDIEIIESTDVSIQPVVRINYRTLGPKLDNRVQEARAAVEASDPRALLDGLLQEGGVQLAIGDDHIWLGDEDLLISYEPVGSLLAASEASTIVVLDTEITHDLQAAGLARDLNREIQNFRRELDLDLTQRVLIRFEASDRASAVIAAHAEFLKREALATNLVREERLPSAREVDFGGSKLRLTIEPVDLPD